MKSCLLDTTGTAQPALHVAACPSRCAPLVVLASSARLITPVCRTLPPQALADLREYSLGLPEQIAVEVRGAC
jgi:hypothetical protein